MSWASFVASRGLVAALATAALLASSAIAQQDLRADNEISLSTPRAGHTATLLDAGYVLIAGGSDGDAVLSSVEVVDSITGAVEPLGSLSTPRMGHTATLLADGFVLITGGLTEEETLASAELFDPLAGISEPAGPMRWARAGHDAVALPDGRVLLLGGADGDQPVARAEVFDPMTQEFKKAGKSKTVHRDPAAALLPDGRVLLTGLPTKEKGRSAEWFDPIKGKWAPVKPAGGTRIGHTASVLADGRVLLVGGSDGNAELWPAELFDPATSSFATAGELFKPRTGHTATVMPDGDVLILGGSRASAIESFDPVTGAITVAGDAGIARTGHTATSLDDGRLLIAGGRFTTLSLDDLLVFDPATGALLPLGDDTAPVVSGTSSTDGRTRSDIRAEHGPPEAFSIFYFDELDGHGTPQAASMEQWSYFEAGVEYTFADDQLVAEDRVGLVADAIIGPAPYDPLQFSAYMSLDEVVAAAGVHEYLGGPADVAVAGGELYFADRLTWGMKDGELRYIEALALQAKSDGQEDE